jgi:MATE family multidrug resistance protein
LTAFYTPDPAVARLAGVLMMYAAIFQLLDALVMVHLCVLRAVGDTRFSLLVTTVCAWGLTVPITLAFGLWLGWGAHGVYLGIIFELIALAGITSWRVGGVKTGKVVRMDLLLGNESS